MSPDELRKRLLGALSQCADPEEACRLLADAHATLATATVDTAAREYFWGRLYEEVLSLAKAMPATPDTSGKWRALTVAQSEINRYRHE